MKNSSPSPTSLDLLRRAVSAIASLEEKDFEILNPFLMSNVIKKGQLILSKGDVCKNIFFLTEGFVRMYYIDFDGNEINFRFTERGNFFVDFQSFLTQKPSNYYWEALQDTELLQISYTSVQQMYKQHVAWNNFGRIMAEHVYQQLNERVEMLLFMKPEERYLHILKSKTELIQHVSLLHLSSYIGIKPESLSRIRKRISKK